MLILQHTEKAVLTQLERNSKVIYLPGNIFVFLVLSPWAISSMVLFVGILEFSHTMDCVVEKEVELVEDQTEI